MDKRAVVEWLRQLPGLRAVYAFGSRISGQARPDSDLDLVGRRPMRVAGGA